MKKDIILRRLFQSLYTCWMNIMLLRVVSTIILRSLLLNAQQSVCTRITFLQRKCGKIMKEMFLAAWDAVAF